MNTFYQIIYKQNTVSDDLYQYKFDSSFESVLDFYKLLYSKEFTNDSKNAIALKLLIYSHVLHARNRYAADDDDIYVGKHRPQSVDIISNATHKYETFCSVITNRFMSKDTIHRFTLAFSSAQKCYNTLRRFVHMYRMKKTPILIKHDLYMNDIAESDSNVLAILQNNQKYLFTASDLINIIETALCNSPDFFSEPLVSKNPYNNMPFQKHDLCNIYFFIKKNVITCPELIHQFFLCNFHLTRFRETNAVLIRKTFIDRFVVTGEPDCLYDYVMDIIDRTKLSVHPDFPRGKLVDIMRPYLKLYLLYLYSLDLNERSKSGRAFNYWIKLFENYNPKFGSKMIIDPKRFFKRATLQNMNGFSRAPINMVYDHYIHNVSTHYMFVKIDDSSRVIVFNKDHVKYTGRSCFDNYHISHLKILCENEFFSIAPTHTHFQDEPDEYDGDGDGDGGGGGDNDVIVDVVVEQEIDNDTNNSDDDVIVDVDNNYYDNDSYDETDEEKYDP